MSAAAGVWGVCVWGGGGVPGARCMHRSMPGHGACSRGEKETNTRTRKKAGAPTKSPAPTKTTAPTKATAPTPRPLRPHLVQVGLHQLKHHVDVLVVARAGRQHDVLDLHNVCGRAVAGGWVPRGRGGRRAGNRSAGLRSCPAPQAGAVPRASPAAVGVATRLSAADRREGGRRWPPGGEQQAGVAAPGPRSGRTWVLQQAQQLDLSQDARGIRHVLEHIVDLLDRHLRARGRVGRGVRGAGLGGGGGRQEAAAGTAPGERPAGRPASPCPPSRPCSCPQLSTPRRSCPCR